MKKITLGRIMSVVDLGTRQEKELNTLDHKDEGVNGNKQ